MHTMPNKFTRNIILIGHNLRSCHNVGSLLRTAEGMGVTEVILSGYTPYPLPAGPGLDRRLPHEALKLHKQIQKTALGAESSQKWRHETNFFTVITQLKQERYILAAIEQTADSKPLPGYIPPQKIALVVGREIEGIEPEILESMDVILEIPMFGSKESFNVVQAAAMALYHCRFYA